MYRISFNCQQGCWLVQIQHFGIFWSTIKEEGKDKTFDDLDKACTYVAKVGIDRVYKDYREGYVHSVLQGEPHVRHLHIPQAGYITKGFA